MYVYIYIYIYMYVYIYIYMCVYVCMKFWMRCAAPRVGNCTLQCGVEGATDERATCCEAVGRRGTLSTHAG